MTDSESKLVEAAEAVNSDSFKKLEVFFKAEENRLKEEMVLNADHETHVYLRAQALVFRRLADLRDELKELIQEM